MPKPSTSVRSIRLPDALWAELSDEAERLGVSVNSLVADSVKGALNPERGTPKLSLAEIAHATAMLEPGRRVRVLPSEGSDYIPLRMPRAPIGSFAKKPKGK